MSEPATMIYVRKGLIFEQDRTTVINAPEADRIARANGETCAERFVKKFAGRCLLLDINNAIVYRTADGKVLKRGDLIITEKYKEPSRLGKSKEDYNIWIITTICRDMVRAKCEGAEESWRQAFYIEQMETIEVSR